MSRVGRNPIPVPKGVTVQVLEQAVRVKGAEGELTQPLPPGIRAELKDGVLRMLRPNDEPRSRAFHGLARALVANAVQGVSKKFEKKLEIVGIGYKATPSKDAVTFNLGYSHPIEFKIPAGVEVNVEKQTSLTVRGIDRELVGRVAAEIRDLKRPDVYKGKGVRYQGERVRQKVGKTGA